MRLRTQIGKSAASLLTACAVMLSASGAGYAAQPQQAATRGNEDKAQEIAPKPHRVERLTVPSGSDGAEFSGDGDTGADSGSDQRIWPFKGKKLKKLPHDLDTTLDPMDDSDPCPTLPCN